MTTAAAPTLVDQQAGLLRELNEVLQRHGAGAAFRLVYTPEELDLAPDQVLVQVVDRDRGVVELHPQSLDQVGPGDVLYDTQNLDPTDQVFGSHALTRNGLNCVVHTKDGSTSHWYVV